MPFRRCPRAVVAPDANGRITLISCSAPATECVRACRMCEGDCWWCPACAAVYRAMLDSLPRDVDHRWPR